MLDWRRSPTFRRCCSEWFARPGPDRSLRNAILALAGSVRRGLSRGVRPARRTDILSTSPFPAVLVSAPELNQPDSDRLSVLVLQCQSEASFFASASRRCRIVGGFDASFATAEEHEFCDRWLHRGYRMICRQHFDYARGAPRFRRMHDRRDVRARAVNLVTLYFGIHIYTRPPSGRSILGRLGTPPPGTSDRPQLRC